MALGGDQGAVGGPGVPVQGHQTMQIIKYFTKIGDMAKRLKICAPGLQQGHGVVPGHGEQLQATYRTLSTKIDVTKVLDNEKSNGGVHFAIEGDKDAVGGPRVPVQVHQTLQTI